MTVNYEPGINQLQLRLIIWQAGKAVVFSEAKDFFSR